MIYDFNQPIDRSDQSTVKYDTLRETFGCEDLIPLWIADMDLKTAQPIIDAATKRAESGIYGYTTRPASYGQALISWQKKRHSWDIDPTLLSYGLGVIQLISYFIERHSNPGDQILFFTPVYNNFATTVERWGRSPLTSALSENDGYYTIDFEDFEAKLQKQPAFVLLCSPHNPVGRVWTRQELTQIGDLCIKYKVPLISDEIHSDLILWNSQFLPFHTLGEAYRAISISCISASKTFNLAGLHAAAVVFPNHELKTQFDTLWDSYHLNSCNSFNQTMVEAAYNHGEEWLDQLIPHLESNAVYVQDYLQTHLPQIKTILPEATFLLWLDCRDLKLGQQELVDFMANKARLGLNDGASYGPEGTGFMRLNFACPRPLLETAMEQLKQAVATL